MAREQERNQPSSDDAVNRRTYLRLSGAVAVGATAAAASASNTSENVISIVGTTAEPTTYEVTVTDEITPGRGTDALSVLGTTGRSAEDAVGNGVRRYRFEGEITHLSVGDGATAFVNGVAIDSTATR
ncbi:hypothetical protein [Salinigranum halophilum]|jgi:hypothetical protein|uniref:hypothetical protein n=1 Tax=Salinigranum halophilum TaxID=2565931 RepID=UPI0010A92B18|nr:hypothetical protein [Salinigranum halophilum]